MPVTLEDVARSTGVSKATVSRVLNDDPRISAATAGRVRQALQDLGYRGTARVADARTCNVAFLVADPIGSVHEDLFFSEVLRGVAEMLEPRGYHAIVSPSSGHLTAAGRPPAVLNRVDGVIAGGPSLDPALVRALMSASVPSVFIGRYLRGKGMNAVLPDNQEGGRLATEHLLALGRQRVAFIGGPPNTNVFRDRLAGYRQGHEEAGVGVDERLVLPATRTAEGGFEGTQALLDRMPSADAPDAIFAADDWIAIGVLRALRQRGMRVPEDVAVVGYSDIPLAPMSEPPLTTVHVPKRRLGRVAAKLLLDLLNGDQEAPVQIVVTPHLVVRQSTAPQGGAS